MSHNPIDEEYCSDCRTPLELVKGDSNINTDRTDRQTRITETYYCVRCSQEYDYEYNLTRITKK